MSDEIHIAGPADRKRVLASLVPAFAADPVLRYLFPDDDTYPPYAAAFFGHLFDKRVAHGTVFTVGGGASVAMWDAPSAPAAAVPLDLPADVRSRVDAYDRALHDALPDQPFWYLGVLGTDPEHRGHRYGHALMADGFRRAAGLPVVLETSNPGNVGVYGRAGFEVFREVTDGPVPVWVMRRAPAGRA